MFVKLEDTKIDIGGLLRVGACLRNIVIKIQMKMKMKL